MRMLFDQSSPLQPISDFRGGTLSVTEERTKEILLSNLGLRWVDPAGGRICHLRIYPVWFMYKRAESATWMPHGVYMDVLCKAGPSLLEHHDQESWPCRVTYRPPGRAEIWQGLKL